MRAVVVVVLLGAAGCRPPCLETSSRVVPSCAAREDGGGFVGYRPYTALDEVFVDECAGEVVDGSLVFTARTRACEPRVSSGATFAECRLPSLTPGRWAVGGATLVVPADGGTARCE